MQKNLQERLPQPDLANAVEAGQPLADTTSALQAPTASAFRLLGKWGMLVGIGIGIALTLGATKFWPTSQPAAKNAAESPAVASQAPAQNITAATANTARVNRTLKATGTVAAFETVIVLSQATGLQIRQILVDEGDTVRAGQTLAILDDSVQQAQLLQAQANVAQAEARLAQLQAGNRREEIARARETVKRIQAEIAQTQSDWELAQKRVQRNRNLQVEGAIAQDRLDEILNEERSKQAALQQSQARLREAQQQLAQLQAGSRIEEIAQATAQLAAAKAQLQAARVELSKTRVISPANGKIAKRNARVGQMTTSFSQTPLFEIVENGQLELQLKIPETQIAAIRPGQVVEISSDADSGLKLAGRVREINATVDADSRQATVKVDLPLVNSLKPGMFLRAEIVTASAISLTVPMKAVLPQADGSGIAYVLQNNGTVKAKSVEMGEILPDERVEIVSGLTVGNRVAVKGAAYLKDGDRISVVRE
jgi:multidrug efflux pump subunit AcrA (membrane-fusion protein)